jgi:ribosomal protein S18 acetylase RimI-like enzyme
MTLRPVASADAAALLALWNRSAPYDSLSPGLLREKVWGDPGFTPDLALVAEDGGALVGFGMGVCWGPPNETRGTVKLLCVAPERRREGVGGALLARIEAGLAAQGAEAIRVAECSPNYLVPGVDLRDTPGWLFVQKHGYAQVGEAVNMDVDLAADDWATADAEAALEARGLAVRRAETADRDAVMSFLDLHWPAWKPEIARTFENEPVSLHLGFRDDRLLGFSAYDANNVGTGWFGPMGTDPTERGLGIGGVLCRRCLRDLRAQGRERATIPWVAPVGFYAHYAGAAVSRVFHRFEKAL